MNVPTRIIVYFLPVVLLISGCSQSSQPGPSIRGEQVIVATSTTDVHFQRVAYFSGTYMIFGGGDFSHADLIARLSISGIPLDKAISIYERYPDFYRCKSPGAALAQNSLIDLDIIPADPEVADIVKDAISQFETRFKNDGDRIFVRLEGEALEMTSAIVREWNEDVMDQYPAQMRDGYYLVTSAEVIEARVVFENH